jgi:monomeric sarcosine oxidase
MKRYNVIVIGTGGVGSSAAFHLARRGQSVLALERFSPGHDRGSSHGQTRIIRKAYFEHADYVPLLQRAYVLWAELEQLTALQLYEPVGLVEFGPPDGVVVSGVLGCAEKYQLPVELLDLEDLRRRFPGFRLPVGSVAVFEQDAGFLHVERCVRAHAQMAVANGCELAANNEVLGWTATAYGVEVRTQDETYAADRLVVAAGAWSSSLLRSLEIPLRVLRKHLHWYSCEDPCYAASSGCPAFFYEVPAGYLYGFPQIDPRGVKVAEHSGGTEIDDPLEDERAAEPDERARVEQFVGECLPGVSRTCSDHAVCYYTMSPDEHFVIDRHPDYEQVVFAAGLSGHGFKFTSVLGEVLADLAVTGASNQPIEFLSCGRFAQ